MLGLTLARQASNWSHYRNRFRTNWWTFSNNIIILVQSTSNIKCTKRKCSPNEIYLSALFSRSNSSSAFAIPISTCSFSFPFLPPFLFLFHFSFTSLSVSIDVCIQCAYIHGGTKIRFESSQRRAEESEERNIERKMKYGKNEKKCYIRRWNEIKNRVELVDWWSWIHSISHRIYFSRSRSRPHSRSLLFMVRLS